MAKRLLLFLLVITIAVTFIGWRLAAGIPAPVNTVIIAIVVLLLAGIFVYPLSFRSGQRNELPSAASRVKRYLVYMDMGFMSFLAALVVLRDLIGGSLSLWRPEWHDTVYSLGAVIVLFIGAFIMLIIGVWQAARAPRVVRTEIPIANLPASFQGFTIAQISDVHLSPNVTPAQVDRIVERLNELKPDLIVATGDIGDGPASLLTPLIDRFKAMQAPALYITGNHEYYWNAAEWIAEFSRVGFKPLLNAHTVIERGGAKLLVAGVVDPAARMAGEEPNLQRSIAGAPSDVAARIFLAHNPGFARSASDAGFDLQLSGHTHAGQFFPWTLVVSRVHEFANGLGYSGKMAVYVNPGTGSWGPPIRLGTRTEISFFTLRA